MEYRVKNINMLLIAMLVLLTGCRDKNTCEQKYINQPIDTPYNSWFSGNTSDWNGGLYDLLSENGLTDKIALSKNTNDIYETQLPYYPGSTEPCTSYSFDNISLYYNTDLYKITFTLSIIQMSDGVHLSIWDYRYYKRSSVYLDYNLSTSTSQNILNYESDWTNTPYLVTVEILPTITIGSTTFTNIYKITNGFLLSTGEETDIVRYYIDTNVGVIRLEQKNGITWNVTHE